MKRSEYEQLREYIYGFKTEYEMGFTNEELMIILNQLGLSNKMDKFFSAMGVRTCAVIEGKTITYHEDILLGVICAKENRQPTVVEWD